MQVLAWSGCRSHGWLICWFGLTEPTHGSKNWITDTYNCWCLCHLGLERTRQDSWIRRGKSITWVGCTQDWRHVLLAGVFMDEVRMPKENEYLVWSWEGLFVVWIEYDMISPGVFMTQWKSISKKPVNTLSIEFNLKHTWRRNSHTKETSGHVDRNFD